VSVTKYQALERSQKPRQSPDTEPVRDGVPASTATTGNLKRSYCSRSEATNSSAETLDIRTALLHGDKQSLAGL